MLRVLALTVLLALPAGAEGVPPAMACSEGIDAPRHCIRADRFAADLCAQIEAEARLHGLPPGFLARLLWQESRFDPNAVSPMRARGIAQFVDGTAALRGLRDPFNPAEAVARAAEYLGEMAGRYGSLGLAAIGYNGGERRAEAWIAGTGGLARETRDYVRIVTGHSAEIWRDAPPEAVDYALDGAVPFHAACEALAATRRVSPMTAEAPPRAPWGVQVGFGRDGRAARAAWDRLAPRCRAAPDATTEVDFVPMRIGGTGSRRTVAVRIGAASRADAEAACATLARSGCPCRVFRNW